MKFFHPFYLSQNEEENLGYFENIEAAALALGRLIKEKETITPFSKKEDKMITQIIRDFDADVGFSYCGDDDRCYYIETTYFPI